jgi:hypothetical protein
MTLSTATETRFECTVDCDIVFRAWPVVKSMTEWDRSRAVERVEQLVETVETDLLPVPVREVWVFGDIALGLDPVERLDVYLTKDLLLSDDTDTAEVDSPVDGVGQTVRAEWAQQYPEYLRTNAGGYAAPERCLAAHLLDTGEPIHLEVCNTGFEDNVTQRLAGARARDDYEQLLDPRGACLWIDGQRSETAFEKLRAGEFAFPPLSAALEMLGLDGETADRAADDLRTFRDRQEGVSVRGDVV